MVNSKDKGKRWERDAVKLLEEFLGGTWKRIPGSGAIGTIVSESRLTGDIVGSVSFIPKRFKFEAKTGYGGSKQLALKKEWLEKIRQEAEADYAIPGLICKFSGARGEEKVFVVFDLPALKEIFDFADEIYSELLSIT